MLENIIALIIISILIASSKERQAVGWLVFLYYSVYIVIEIDFFGFTVGNLFTTHNQFMLWYLIYTAISSIFLIASLVIYIYTQNKTPLVYALWILFNMFISGLSAIFQAFETNALLIVYNVLQNINLLIDIITVILGTDTKIKGMRHVRSIANCVFSCIIHYINLLNKNSYRAK